MPEKFLAKWCFSHSGAGLTGVCGLARDNGHCRYAMTLPDRYTVVPIQIRKVRSQPPVSSSYARTCDQERSTDANQTPEKLSSTQARVTTVTQLDPNRQSTITRPQRSKNVRTGWKIPQRRSRPRIMTYGTNTKRGVDKSWTSTGLVVLDRGIATGQGQGHAEIQSSQSLLG
jgi:hypothetical protein